ncbi:MAG: ATP-binding protein [Anaerolineae bacterium]
MPELRARLFGAPHIVVGDDVISVRSGKALGLLCYLLATRQVHSRDRLASFFWPDVPERKALASLRTALYDVRRALGDHAADVLLVDRTRVGLQPGAEIELDLAAVEAVGATEGEVLPETALAAVDAYAGPLLDGVSLSDAYDFDDWLFLERERLLNMFLTALCRLDEHYTALGDHDRAAEAARRVLAEDPLREDVHRSLMLHLAASGQRAAAMNQYATCEALLARELGVAPLPSTRTVYEQIRANEAPVIDVAGPAPLNRAAASRVPHAGTDPLGMLEAGSALVGRSEALRGLRDELEAVEDGQVRFVVIEGEAGIGKTRLVAEHARALGDGATVVVGRCHESTRAEPYGPVIDALRRALPAFDLGSLSVPEVWLREIARLLPELEGRLAVGASAPLDGVRDRDRLFEAVRVLMSALAGERALVWVTEDVHWCDETSLSLLSFVARGVDSGRVQLVVTCRGEEIGPERRAVLRRLAHSGRHVALTALTVEESAELVAAVSGSEELPLRFGGRLHRSTGGNPYFLIETIRALFEQRSLVAEGEAWATAAGSAENEYAALPVPESVELIVSSRLERLSDDARALLESAAVLRRDFAFDLVQPASRLSATEALDALDELVRLGVVTEVHADGSGLEAKYDFTHALVRDYVYGSLTGARRQFLHRQVAGLLESAQPVAADRVAYHYLRGGVRDRACAWSLRAGSAALAVYAGEDALVHFRSARELAVSSEEEYAAVSGLGRAFVSLGRHEEAIRSFEAALPKAPDAEAAADLHRSAGRAHERRGAFDHALESYASARKMLHGRPLSMASVRIADGLATVYVRLGRCEEAVELCRDGLRWLGEHPDEDGAAEAEAWLRNTLGMALLHAREYSLAIESLQLSLAGKRLLGDRLGEATLLNNLGVVHYHCGDDEAAREQYSESLAIKTEIGDRYGRAIALTNLALMETHLGRLDEAESLLEDAAAAAGAVGAAWLVPEIGRVSAQRALAAGDLARAREQAEGALAAAEDLGVPAFIGVAHRVMGLVKASDDGDQEGADAHFETSLAVFEMLENEHELAKTHAAYGASLLDRGMGEAAGEHLRAALDEFTRSGATGRATRLRPLLDRER